MKNNKNFNTIELTVSAAERFIDLATTAPGTTAPGTTATCIPSLNSIKNFLRNYVLNQKCPENTDTLYNSENNICYKCPNNTDYNPVNNRCEECSEDKRYNNTTKRCEPCPVNLVYNFVTKLCEGCPTINTQVDEKSKKCISCPTNTSTLDFRNKSYTAPCPYGGRRHPSWGICVDANSNSGTVIPDRPGGPCLPCMSGHKSFGGSNCIKCTNSNSIIVNNQCVPCPDGQQVNESTNTCLPKK
jgi:hypothetical protein